MNDHISQDSFNLCLLSQNIFTSASFHTQGFLSLDDRLHGHPIYAQ